MSILQHKLRWVTENRDLGWKLVDLLDLMMLSMFFQPSCRLRLGISQTQTTYHQLMLPLNLVQCLKLVLLHFLHNPKGFNNSLPVCISRDGTTNLSQLTQIVIERELVIVPDLEDKLWWDLVFCLVQAPEVLLKSHQKRKQGSY